MRWEKLISYLNGTEFSLNTYIFHGRNNNNSNNDNNNNSSENTNTHEQLPNHTTSMSALEFLTLYVYSINIKTSFVCMSLHTHKHTHTHYASALSVWLGKTSTTESIPVHIWHFPSSKKSCFHILWNDLRAIETRTVIYCTLFSKFRVSFLYRVEYLNDIAIASWLTIFRLHPQHSWISNQIRFFLPSL